ncbi:MAG: hypothetical protein ILP19_05335, partial [Oscillospiraceae bacterium]|nr:hypothetical protein [Oscillospiraceae bacterium]
MKTSIRHRLMRLGILCGGIGIFLAALIGVSYILNIEKSMSDELGSSVVNSVTSSMQEEMTFLANGLRDSYSGDNNDIFNNVFLMGEERSYDYSDFEADCASLTKDGVLVCYLPAARCHLFALGRGSDIIVGELREGYFDYVTDTMSGDGKYGFIVNNKNGDVLISSEKGKCGTNITGQTVYAENFAACTAGDALITGDMFTDFVVYSGSLPQNSEFGVIYQVDSDMIYGKGKRAILIMAVLTAVMIILVTIVSTLFARRISASIAPTVECLDKFSEGTIDTSF